MKHDSNRTYLDYAASTPLKKAALDAMQSVLAETGNASSIHSFGRNARQRIEEARALLASKLGVKTGQVIFTSGATEANNMALKGLPAAAAAVSAIEHASVLESSPQAQRIKVTKDGVIDLNDLESFLKAAAKPALVSLMCVNNETGVIQPLKEAVALAKNHGALVHCDAVQAFGKIPLNFPALGIDALSLSAHKIGGPQGIGALIVREGLMLQSFMQGGGQEMRRRAGTENVAAISGFGAAVSTLDEDLSKQDEWQSWRNAFEEKILRAAPDTVIFGKAALRVSTISCIAMPNAPAETQLMAFDLAGFAVSSGSACSSGKVQASHVLKATGAPLEQVRAAIRLSFGAGTTAAALEKFADVWLDFRRRKQRRAA